MSIGSSWRHVEVVHLYTKRVQQTKIKIEALSVRLSVDTSRLPLQQFSWLWNWIFHHGFEKIDIIDRSGTHDCLQFAHGPRHLPGMRQFLVLNNWIERSINFAVNSIIIPSSRVFCWPKKIGDSNLCQKKLEVMIEWMKIMKIVFYLIHEKIVKSLQCEKTRIWVSLEKIRENNLRCK